MKQSIDKKIITAGFGLALLILTSVDVVSYWSAATAHDVQKTMLISSIGTALSFALLFSVYYLLQCSRTKQQQAEDALRQSEELHRIILCNISDAVFITDSIGAFTYVCPNGNVIFGYSQQEIERLGNIDQLLGKNLFEMNQLETCGEIRNIEREITDKFGRQHVLLVNAKRVSINGGTVLYTCRDITERKQVQEALQKSEGLYRTLANNLPDGAVFLFDKNLRYTLAEGKELAETGLSKELLPGKTIWEVFSPEICEMLEPHYRAALTGRTAVFEMPYADRIYKVQVLPMKNEQGEISAGLVMTQNISDRKQTELALQQERNFVSTVLDTASALIVVLDLEGRIIRFNPACEQATGYSFDEVKGKPFWNLFLVPEELESVQAVVEQLRRGQFPIQHENDWVARDGSRKLISWSNTVLLDAEGEIKYIISIGIDITERKRTEEMRCALEKEKDLRKLQLRFFSMVSHEFRTPISSILLSAQSLELYYEGWSKEKILKSLHRIECCAKNMTQLLEDILTINRAESGSLEFNPKRLNLEQFCLHRVAQLQLLDSNQHPIILAIQGECQEVYMDEKLLYSILNNLLVNAIKYSPQGRKIYFSLIGDQGEMTFRIRDEGIGIPAEDLPHLFEPFHRGANVGTISGRGLGITVAKKCLDLQGGKISIESEVECGTTVTVTIPSF